MKNRKNDSKRTATVLGNAILAAGWLVNGPDILLTWGIGETANDLLTWMPAMSVFFWSIASDKQKLACEARAFKRLIGR